MGAENKSTEIINDFCSLGPLILLLSHRVLKGYDESYRPYPTPHPKASTQIHWILPRSMGPPSQMKPIHGPGTQIKKPVSRIPQFDIIFLSAPEGNHHKNFLLNLRFSMKICVSLRYGYNFVSLTTLSFLPG